MARRVHSLWWKGINFQLLRLNPLSFAYREPKLAHSCCQHSNPKSRFEIENYKYWQHRITNLRVKAIQPKRPHFIRSSTVTYPGNINPHCEHWSHQSRWKLTLHCCQFIIEVNYNRGPIDGALWPAVDTRDSLFCRCLSPNPEKRYPQTSL